MMKKILIGSDPEFIFYNQETREIYSVSKILRIYKLINEIEKTKIKKKIEVLNLITKDINNLNDSFIEELAERHRIINNNKQKIKEILKKKEITNKHQIGVDGTYGGSPTGEFRPTPDKGTGKGLIKLIDKTNNKIIPKLNKYLKTDIVMIANSLSKPLGGHIHISKTAFNSYEENECPKIQLFTIIINGLKLENDKKNNENRQKDGYGNTWGDVRTDNDKTIEFRDLSAEWIMTKESIKATYELMYKIAKIKKFDKNTIKRIHELNEFGKKHYTNDPNEILMKIFKTKTNTLVKKISKNLYNKYQATKKIYKKNTKKGLFIIGNIKQKKQKTITSKQITRLLKKTIQLEKKYNEKNTILQELDSIITEETKNILLNINYNNKITKIKDLKLTKLTKKEINKSITAIPENTQVKTFIPIEELRIKCLKRIKEVKQNKEQDISSVITRESIKINKINIYNPTRIEVPTILINKNIMEYESIEKQNQLIRNYALKALKN